MSFPARKHEIESLLNTLDEAKQKSGLSADDPSVIALQQIILAKVADLEDAIPPTPPISVAVALNSDTAAVTDHPAAPEMLPVPVVPADDDPATSHAPNKGPQS